MRGGGAEKVTLLLANELVARKWNVVLALSSVEGPFLEQLDSNIRILQLSSKRMSKNFFSIKRILERENPQIFYTSMNYVNIIGAIAHKLSRTRSLLVISEHNDFFEFIERTTFTYRLIFKYGVKFTYSFAHQIVCVSAGVESSLKKCFPTISRTTVIYNPIEQYEVSPISSNSSDNFNILSIGRLSKQKNYPLLIKAFRYLLDNFHINAVLTIVGEGEERSELERLIEINDLQKNVFLVGFQNPKQFLNEADVFVLSSEREGFGNVLVEALSAGLPVISTDCPSGPSEILEYGRYGMLVSRNDHKAIANAIYEVYNIPEDPNIREFRKKRARDFSPSKITLEYLELFTNLLNERDFRTRKQSKGE